MFLASSSTQVRDSYYRPWQRSRCSELRAKLRYMNAAYETEIATSSMPQDALPYKHFRKAKAERKRIEHYRPYRAWRTRLKRGAMRAGRHGNCATGRELILCKIEQIRNVARVIKPVKPGHRNRDRIQDSPSGSSPSRRFTTVWSPAPFYSGMRVGDDANGRQVANATRDGS